MAESYFDWRNRLNALRSGTGGSGFVPTQLGDPDFSQSTTPGSQLQYPAATAEHRLYDVQTRASNLLSGAAMQGYDTSSSAYAQVNQAANHGFMESALTLGESLLGWIDGPRQAVNMLIQDIAGAGIEEGKENPGFGDYWDAFWGGINDPESMEARTGINPSGSATLERLGWDEADTFWGRVGRGVGHFALDMATDPLTYVTFGLSGLGKKAALGAATAAKTAIADRVMAAVGNDALSAGLEGYSKNLLAKLTTNGPDSLLVELADDLAAQAAKTGGTMPPDVQRALLGHIGNDAGEASWESIGRMALENKIDKEITKPLLNRDFATLKANGVLEELPFWARGGARISVPFGRGLEHGWAIPGTEGIGKKAIGDPLRRSSQKLKELSPTYNKIAKGLSGGLDRFDSMRPLLNGLKDGSIEPWQWQIASTAVDRFHNTASRDIIIAQLNEKMQAVDKIAAEHGYDDLAEMHSLIMDSMEKVSLNNTLEEQFMRAHELAGGTKYDLAPPALRNAIDDAAKFLSETLDQYHRALSVLDPTVKERWIDGYIPHATSKEARSILDQLADKGAVPPAKHWKDAQAQGKPGKALFAMLINAIGDGGKLETQMGASRYLQERVLGRVHGLQLLDDGVIMLDEEAMAALADDVLLGNVLEGGVLTSKTETRYMPASKLNELLEPVIREQSKEWGITIPKNWDGKVFSEDPFEVAQNYIHNLHDAISAWEAVESLRAAGLAMNHSSALDVYATAQKMMANLQRRTEKIEHVRFGIPDENTREAPTGWLSSLQDAETMAEVHASPTPKQVKTVQKHTAFLRKVLTDPDAKGGEEAWARTYMAIEDELGYAPRSLQAADDAYSADALTHADKKLAIFENELKYGKVGAREFQLGRSHSGKPIMGTYEDLKESVLRHGVEEPVTVGISDKGEMFLQNGHARVAIAEELGLDELPVEYELRDVADHSTGVFLKDGDRVPGMTHHPATSLHDAQNVWNALMSWAGGSQKIMLRRYQLEGPDKFKQSYGPAALEKMEALIRAYNAGAVETPNLTRVASFNQAMGPSYAATGELGPEYVAQEALISGRVEYKVGDKVEFTMESASPSAVFAEETAASGQHPGVEFDFPPDEKALPNPHNTADLGYKEDEYLVSGQYKVIGVSKRVRANKADTNIPTEVTAYQLERTGDALPIVSPHPPIGEQDISLNKLSNTYNAHQVFRHTPWQPAVTETTYKLKNYDLLGSKIDLKVLRQMREAGFDVKSNIAEAARGVWRWAQMDRDEFIDASIVAKASGNPATILADKHNVAVAFDDKNGVFSVKIRGNLNIQDRRAAYEEAIDRIDNFFTSGKLMGQLNGDTVGKLVTLAEDETTSRVLYNWLNRKMASLPDNVTEFITGEAAEVVQTRALYDAWEEEFNSFIKAVSAGIDSNGNLVPDANRIKSLGDEEVMAHLQRVKDAARNVSESGYDELVKIMRDVDDFTGVSDVPGYVNPLKKGLGGPAVEGMALQANMASWLRNVARNSAIMFTPEGTAAAKLAARNTLRWWRGMATIARPTFHIRNLVGGSWMNMIGGVTNREYRMVSNNAIKLRNALTAGKSLEEALDSLPKGAREVFRAAWENDVMSGFSTTEFRQLTTSAKKGRMAWANAFDTDNFFLTRAGGRIMESIEDLLRVSMFARHYDPARPETAKLAKEMVHAFHFDYNDLTPLETKIKSFIPFFVWTRRNLPRQVELAFENPRTVQRYRAMMDAMDDNFGTDDNGMPLGDNFTAHAVGTDYYVNPETPFWARVVIDPDLPIRDLLEVPVPTLGNLIEYANEQLGPHISLLGDINSEREFGDVNSPAPFNAIMRSLAYVGLFDETLDGDVRIPYYMRTALETALPWGREIIDPLSGGPSDPSRQQRLGISQDDGLFERDVKSMLATLAKGFGVKLSTPADIRSTASRSQEELDQIIYELRLQGLIPPSEG